MRGWFSIDWLSSMMSYIYATSNESNLESEIHSLLCILRWDQPLDKHHFSVSGGGSHNYVSCCHSRGLRVKSEKLCFWLNIITM
mmetsp:Transcript_26852/g.39732  ORF Transcript_26852/g.39732 Transcript_26852/m.39732 type:complete len:84 (-) Transcript_26852:87-338(-)